MNAPARTNPELIEEISVLKQRIQVLEQSELELKQTEEAIRESEERYKRLMEAAPIGFCVVDTSGNIQYVNQRIEEVSGYSWDELIGLNGFTANLFSAESTQLLAERLAFRIGGSLPHPNEIAVPFIRKDGTQIWIEINTAVLKKDGVPIGVQLSMRDITYRKRAEEALRESEERYRALASSADSMYLVDRECRYQFMNAAHLLRFDMSLDEVTGRAYGDFHSEEDTKQFAATIEAVFETGKSFQTEHKGRIGDSFFLRTFSPVKNLQGSVTAVTVISKDVTRRKLAEGALILSEYKLKELFENMSSSVAVYEAAADGEDFIFRNFNRAAEEAEQIDRKEVIGKSVLDVFPGIRNIGLFDVFQRVWRTGKPEHLPVSLYKDKRIEGWRENYVYKLPTGEIVTIYNDVTARKKTEDTLRESEARFANIFNASPVAIAISRLKDDRLIDINSAWQKVTGYSREEVIGRTPFELNTWVNRGERDQLISILREQVTVRNFHFQLRHKSGTVLEMLMSAELTELAGERYMLSLAQDITERKQAEEALRQSEEKYRDIFNKTVEGIYRTTPAGRFLILNPTFARICGYASPEEMMEKVTDIANQLYANPEDRLRFQKLMAAKGKVKGFEVQFKHPTKGLVWISINSEVLRDEQGNIQHYNGVIEDVTEYKRAEKEIKASHQQLRALAGRLQSVREEQRKQIAREIHDELGGALTALKIDLSFLASSAPKSRDKTKRDSFLGKMLEMSKLIDETIGTVRKLVTELRPSILDDFGLLAALEWQLQEFEKRTGIQSEFVSTLEYINMDEELSTAVFRIFQESLTNVARHANATKVTATLYKVADCLVLKVEDNGKGISEDDIHNTKSVGLIGMREHALFLGGTVNFSCEPSKGTTVLVQFPFESQEGTGKIPRKSGRRNK